METLEQATVVFTLAIALALVIERIIEICKALYDLLDTRRGWAAFWTRRARRIRDRLERRLAAHGWIDPAGAARILTRFDEMMLGPRDGHHGTVPVLSGDLVRAVHVRAGARLLSVALGIVAAWVLRVDLVAWARELEPGVVPAPTAAGIALTGLTIGLGSAIVHKVIGQIEDRRRRAAEVR